MTPPLFLVLLALQPLPGLLQATGDNAAPPATELLGTVDVVVVGTGLAGLTVATRLLQGDPNITVVPLTQASMYHAVCACAPWI